MSEVTAVNPCNLSPREEVNEGNGMLGRERWEQVRRMYGEGKSLSLIARETHLDRKTVRRCLRQEAWKPYGRTTATPTLLAPHMAWLTERAPQVRFSARILFQELRASRAYGGGYDTVRNAVRPLRAEAVAASLTQCRFETAPGQQSQVDWGQVRVPFATGSVAIHIFVLTLGYSRRMFAEGYEHERIGSLLDAHERAFAYFDGHTAEILYDRMRTVVLGTENDQPRWNSTFDSFARHWAFEPRLCRPYRAQTKGKVESGVKYIKRNFVPGRSFRDLDDFNTQLRAWLSEIADVRIHGTTHQRPLDRFATKAPALIDITGHPSFVQAMVRDRVVADDWLVSVDSNRYSVRCRLIGKTVQVVRSGGYWQIFHQGQLVAEHAVLAGRYQLSVLPEHGPGALARNARTRFPAPVTLPRRPLDTVVEVRDLAEYDACVEVAA